MEMIVTRQWNDDLTYISTMTLDGTHECYVLEGVATAIPKGRYEVTLRPSPKFNNALVPHLENVPGRQFILIHPGNTKEDTLGCLLVGEQMGVDEIMQSQIAYKALMVKLTACVARGEKMYITVQ